MGGFDAPFLPADLRGRPPASVGYVWVGDPEAGRRLLPALQALGLPVAERVQELSYLDLQRIEDSPDARGLRRYWKGHYFRTFPDEAIEAYLLRGTRDGPGRHLPNVGLQAYGGAIADRADSDTAFSHRDTMFEHVAAAGWSNPEEDSAGIGTARRCAAALERFAAAHTSIH